jgi:hypothetical protein
MGVTREWVSPGYAEGNEGTETHLDELHAATMAFLAKHVADRDVTSLEGLSSRSTGKPPR